MWARWQTVTGFWHQGGSRPQRVWPSGHLVVPVGEDVIDTTSQELCRRPQPGNGSIGPAQYCQRVLRQPRQLVTRIGSDGELRAKPQGQVVQHRSIVLIRNAEHRGLSEKLHWQLGLQGDTKGVDRGLRHGPGIKKTQWPGGIVEGPRGEGDETFQ